MVTVCVKGFVTKCVQKVVRPQVTRRLIASRKHTCMAKRSRFKRQTSAAALISSYTRKRAFIEKILDHKKVDKSDNVRKTANWPRVGRLESKSTGILKSMTDFETFQ